MTGGDIYTFVVEEEKIMTVPEKYECPKELYDIMKKCWSLDPESRPEFKFISDFLVEFIIEIEKQYIQ